MRPGDIYLEHNERQIKLPSVGRKLSWKYIESVRSDETANGRLVEDIIWRKKEWTINYEIMMGEFLEAMVELYESGDFLILIIVNRDGSVDKHKVKMKLNPPARWKIIGPWYWQGGTIELRQVEPNKLKR